MRWLCYLSLRELICNRFVQVFVCDDVKLAQLVRCRTVNPKDVGSIPAKTQKKTRIQIYMDLSYIDPQARVLNDCCK